MVEKPTYKHNCKSCIFLGTNIANREQEGLDSIFVDIWVHPLSSDQAVLIRRFGNDVDQFLSYHPTINNSSPNRYFVTVRDRWNFYKRLQNAYFSRN